MPVNTDSTLIISHQLLQISTETKNESLKAYALYMEAVGYQLKTNYALSIETYLKALPIFEKEKDAKGISWVYNDLGMICIDQAKYKEALDYSLKSLKYKKITGDKFDIEITIGNIAQIYYKQKLYKEAINQNIEVVQYLESQKHGDQYSNVVNNMGWYYLGLNQVDSAEAYFKKGINISQKIGNNYVGSQIMEGFAECYLIEKKYKLAEIYATQAWKMASDLKNVENQRDISNTFSKIYEASSDFKNALKYQKLFKTFSDSMINLSLIHI